MSKETKDQKEKFEEAFQAAQGWMDNYGIVTSEGHKQLKRMLETSVKGLKDLKYYVDDTAMRVEVDLFFGGWKVLLSDTSKISKGVLEVLRNCLPEYEIRVEVKKYRKD